MTDEDIPDRVRQAEERREFRDKLERSSLGAPGAQALRKIGAWQLGVPGAEEPTAAEIKLAVDEMQRDMKRPAAKAKRRRRPSGSPQTDLES